MKLHTIRYLFAEGFKGLWKNRMMAIASMGTIVLCLIILGISYSIAQNVEYIIYQIERQLGITAYIDLKLDEAEIKEMTNIIEETPYVYSVEYISKDDALLKFSENDPNLYYEFKDDNPLPASFEIIVTEAIHQQDVVAFLKRINGLEVDYFEAETDIYIELNNSIQFFSGIMIVALVVISLLLIANTITLTVYVRKKEIEIMKYIGATDAFIRLPFLIEGLAIGILGAIVPTVIIYNGYNWAQDIMKQTLGQILGGIVLKPTDAIMMEVIPLFFGLAITISALGSGIAIRKHLKV
ncbi:MAG: hypothetical protein ATN36_03480 [Epulopiscium sp. Nele67-Bin005]|nr:MAG: hypothetical protein ATN36_03480 [Epulopiscium sp. Nele67-Bin005]